MVVAIYLSDEVGNSQSFLVKEDGDKYAAAMTINSCMGWLVLEPGIVAKGLEALRYDFTFPRAGFSALLIVLFPRGG